MNLGELPQFPTKTAGTQESLISVSCFMICELLARHFIKRRGKMRNHNLTGL